MNTAFRLLLFWAVFLTIEGMVWRCPAQDDDGSSTDSTSAEASRRYEAAGASMDAALYEARYSQAKKGDASSGAAPDGIPEAANTNEIPEQNVDRLTSLPVRQTYGSPPGSAASKPDLILTGVITIGGVRCAAFQVVKSGAESDSFVLQEGQANEWLEIQSVDAKSGVVSAVLKQPVMRIRNVGSRVILSLQDNRPNR